MTNIFKGSTNGGAKRFFVQNDKIMVAGPDVSGRQEVTLGVLEDVWGMDIVETGKITGELDTSQINEQLETSDNRTDGSIDSNAEGAAINFALFLERMLTAEAFDFIADARADPSKFTNADEAIDRARYSENSGEVIFAGLGVSGRTTTDKFPSEGASGNFIDTIQLANSENGLLDDMFI